jgi:hypothetical protein
MIYPALFNQAADKKHQAEGDYQPDESEHDNCN